MRVPSIKCRAKWYRPYQVLHQYMTDHPEILIGEEIIAIPENIKSEFYNLFDDIRLTFLKSQFPRLSDEINLLKKAYLQEEEGAKKRLGLKEILIPLVIKQFLQAPHDCLKRECLDPLFQLLKWQVDPELFEKTVSIRLQNTYAWLNKSLYQKWVILALINLLNADKNYVVNPPDLDIGAREPIVPADPRPVPQPRESKTVSFIKETIPAFIVPDIIIRSEKMGQYISFKSELTLVGSVSEVLWTARHYSKRQRWHNFGPDRAPSGLTQAVLIYKDRLLKDTCLIADSKRLYQPDLIIECATQKDQLEEVLIRINHYRKVLKPRKGIFIILKDLILEESLEKRCKGIHLLQVGLNSALLQPVIELF